MDKRGLYELRQQMGGEDPFMATAQARMETYNKSKGEDDGTGVQCCECNNRGVIAFLDDGQLRARDCKCRGTRLTVQRLQRLGLYEKAQKETLDRYRTDTETRRALKQIAEGYIAEKDPQWLLLCGQSGAGKTHLCTAAFVQISFDRGIDGRYLIWNSDGRRIKAATKEGDERLLNEFKEARLLYIDDLFKCKRDAEPSDADVRLAYEILDHRYSHKLPTIISTEMLPEEIRDLDEAIYRRIHEMCGSYIGNIGRDPNKCFFPR